MRSIRSKIMIIIGGVIILALAVSGVIVGSITSKTVMKDESYIAKVSTQKLVSDVNNYFAKYINVAQQMAHDINVEKLLESGADSANAASSPYYMDAKRMLEKTMMADTENILSAFVASSSSDLAFDGVDWHAEAGFDLSEKSYAFNSNADLEKGLVITEPYQDVATGEMVVTVSVPVYGRSGSTVGVAAIDISIADLNEMVSKAEGSYETGYQMLVSASGNVLADKKDENRVLKNVKEIGFSQEMLDDFENPQEEVVLFEDNGVVSYGVVGTIDCAGWKIASVVPEKEFVQVTTATMRTITILYVVCCIVVLLVMYLLSRSITAPLKQLTVLTDELAAGNLDIEIDVQSKDEVGRLANSMKHLTARLRTYIDYIGEVSGALEDFGNGNLNIQLHLTYDGEFARLKESMLQTVAVFKRTIGEIVSIAEQVSSGSDQVASGAQMLAQGTTEQASSIEELSATIQDISSNVNENAQSALDAASQVEAVGREADESSVQMKHMLSAIEEINSKSAEIGKIIKTIDDIAFQTNILALNAAVEAARAGTAGKGFAVVADEVRNLASKSAEAAKDTTVLIEDSIRAVENGTAIAKKTEQVLNDVLSGVTETVSLIDGISKANSSQAENLAQTLIGVDQISSVVQTNSATAEQSSAASEELASQAAQLKKVSEQFRL